MPSEPEHTYPLYLVMDEVPPVLLDGPAVSHLITLLSVPTRYRRGRAPVKKMEEEEERV